MYRDSEINSLKFLTLWDNILRSQGRHWPYWELAIIPNITLVGVYSFCHSQSKSSMKSWSLRAASGPQIYVKSTCGSNRQRIYTATSYAMMNRPKNWLLNFLHGLIINSKLSKVSLFNDWEWMTAELVNTIHPVPRQRMYGIQNRVDRIITLIGHTYVDRQNSYINTLCYESPACMKGYSCKILGRSLYYSTLVLQQITSIGPILAVTT